MHGARCVRKQDGAAHMVVVFRDFGNLRANAGEDAAAGHVDAAGGDAEFLGDLSHRPALDLRGPERPPRRVAELSANQFRRPQDQLLVVALACSVSIESSARFGQLFQEVRSALAVNLLPLPHHELDDHIAGHPSQPAPERGILSVVLPPLDRFGDRDQQCCVTSAVCRSGVPSLRTSRVRNGSYAQTNSVQAGSFRWS